MKHFVIVLILTALAVISVKAEIVTIDVDVEKAEITDNKLVEFLRGSIIPFLKANETHNIRGTVYLSPVSGDSIFSINAMNGSSLQSIYASVRYPYHKFYITNIDDMRFYITSKDAGASWFRPTNTKVHLGQFQKERDDLLKLTLNDDYCEWTIEQANDNGYRITSLTGLWSSWLKNKRVRSYMPNPPLKRLENNYRPRPSIPVEYLTRDVLPGRIPCLK